MNDILKNRDDYKKFGLSINNSYYVFDLVESFAVNETAEVSEFPLVNKTLMVDHKFNKPRVIQLSLKSSSYNKFNKIVSYNEKNNTLQFEDYSGHNILNKVYNFFKDIKNKNVLVNLFTPSLRIKDCILSEFSWNDENNEANYSLTFNEIKTYNFLEAEAKNLEPDRDLPDVNDAINQNAIENLLLKDSRETDLVIYNALKEKDLIGDNVVKGWGEFKALFSSEFWENKQLGIAIGGAVAVGAVVGVSAVALGVKFGLIAGVGLATLLTNPVGWVVILVVIAIAVIGVIIWALVMWIKKLQRRRMYLKEFEDYKDSDGKKKEALRYGKLVSNIYNDLTKLNNVINAYSIKSNVKQEILIDMDGNYYTLLFERNKQGNNAGSLWYYTIKNVENVIVQDKQVLTPFISFYKCKNENYVFKVGNDKLYFTYDMIEVAKDMDKQKNLNKNNVPEYRKDNIDLTKLNIIITKFDLSKLHETIGKIAVENMKRK